MQFEPGQRVRLPIDEPSGWVTVDFARDVTTGWQLYVVEDDGTLHKVQLTEEQAAQVEVLSVDGAADSARVLAGLWTRWMRAAAMNAAATMLASSPLRPYAHQSNAVYGAMLPQPRLRFLLADEPGTGKTIMAGLYLREAQKLGMVNRALVVAPAGLVSKWQEDFARFFNGELRRITNETIQQHGLAVRHDMWIVSLELAAVNPAVQEAIRPDRAGWDVVVFDEAHRLTPTAETLYRVGTLLTRTAPRALLMTATPHRGSEWLFRHLLHLVDPDVYPSPGGDPKADLRSIKPGPVHFLRRMKEDLLDYDERTPLFKGRRATNWPVPLNSVEHAFYQEALGLVDDYFPPTAAPLARIVYGKRAASSLYALAETLKRRREAMGTTSTAEAVQLADPNDEDPIAQDEARVIAEASKSARQERHRISDLLSRLEPLLESDDLLVSKWPYLTEKCLRANGIEPGGSEQAVVFTEYTDTADWLVGRLSHYGFSARRYSGRDLHSVRDEIRADFMAGRFQIIVSTDAGNEGIDLQVAHVLVNYDIPWSLVRLEQRMGRIHRVGQTRDVELYSLIAQGTREGDVLVTLLENFITAANQLRGQLFDSLSLVAELSGLREDRLTGLLADTYADDEAKRAASLVAARAITSMQLRSTAEQTRKAEAVLASTVDVAGAVRRLHEDMLERVNPAIVEAYLVRLHNARVLGVAGTASGEGVLRLTPIDIPTLPEGLGGERQALVVTSGKALTDARSGGATLSSVIVLGPGESAFASLVDYADDALAADIFRSGVVTDPTSISDYDLFTFEGVLREADGMRTTPWGVLVRVDATGARSGRWETLANLVPTTGTAGPPHPARELDAQARAEQLAGIAESERRLATRAWLTKAEKELQDLPTRLSQHIRDRDERIGARKQLEQMAGIRLYALRRLADVRIEKLRQTAHVVVRASGIPPAPTEADSEQVAMKRVHDLLARDGWAVADVHTDGRGYDLYAARGQAQRCVEVKGVWRSAASDGIRLTGNEILIATQQRGDYWLYVVDQCSDGSGEIFGVYRDPVATFAGQIQQQAVFTLPGSALKAAREHQQGAAE